MKLRKITILLAGLLLLLAISLREAVAQSESNPKAGAKKLTVTLVRWPYT